MCLWGNYIIQSKNEGTGLFFFLKVGAAGPSAGHRSHYTTRLTFFFLSSLSWSPDKSLVLALAVLSSCSARQRAEVRDRDGFLRRRGAATMPGAALPAQRCCGASPAWR